MSRVTLAQARALWPTNRKWWGEGAAAADLEQRFRDGATYLELAEHYSTNPNDVYERCKQIGLPGKYPRSPASHGLGRPARAVPTGTERICLCCRRPFMSWGIGNRLCSPCKESAAATSPIV